MYSFCWKQEAETCWNLPWKPDLGTLLVDPASEPCLRTHWESCLWSLSRLETSLVILLENFIWEPCLENLGKLSGEPAFSPHSMPLLGEKCKLTQVEPQHEDDSVSGCAHHQSVAGLAKTWKHTRDSQRQSGDRSRKSTNALIWLAIYGSAKTWCTWVNSRKITTSDVSLREWATCPFALGFSLFPDCRM